MTKKLLTYWFSSLILTSLHSQNVGIGITNPLQKLDINGNIAINNNTIYLKNGNNLAHGLQYSTSVDGPYLFGWQGGALGTKDLPHSLTWNFYGDVGIRANLLVDSAEENDGSIGSSLRFGGWSGEAIGSKRTAGGNHHGLDFYTSNTNRLAITQNGNVGVGNTNPLQKLDISGNASFNDSSIYLRAGNDLNHGLRYSASVDGPYLFGFAGGSLGTTMGPDALQWDWLGNVWIRNNLTVDSAGMNNGEIYNALHFGGWTGEAIGSKRTAGGNQNGLDFYTNTYNRMAITIGGNVGIGTTNPMQKLDINGNACVNDNSIYLRDGNDLNHGLRYKVSIDGPFLFGFAGGALGTANNPDALRWDGSGNVAIRSNLTVDTATLNNGSLNNGLRFGAVTGGEGIGSKKTAGGNLNGLDFYTAFNNRMAITNAGNVGIGTTTPTSKLEVNGETKTASLKVGNNGTSISIVQKGTFTVGTSAGAFKQMTFNFPNAFTSTPVLVVTVKCGLNVDDTFVATIRSISNTSVTINILRVDTASGWSQNLMIDWIAVQ